MIHPLLAGVRHYLRELGPAAPAADSDAALLGRFLGSREEGAFAALVDRHGPLVLGVCRQLLHHEQDAEDAFQATFLVLARKAASLRRGTALAAWLHRVAVNIARDVLVRNAQQRHHEREALLCSTASGPAGAKGEVSDWQAPLHEEVGRLPEKYRVPIVLCYLQGQTHDETARQLGWPVGTVKGRLARARALLHTRLTRRGLAPAAAGATMVATVAAVPAALAALSVRAAAAFVSGRPAAPPASASSILLAQGALNNMTSKRLFQMALWVVAAAVGLGGLVVLGSTRAIQGGDPAEPPAFAPQGKQADEPAPAPATRAGGAEFQLVAEGQVRIPATGDNRPLAIALRIKNVSDKPLVFYNTVRFTLTTPDGKPLPMQGGRDGKRVAAPLTVAPGKEIMLAQFATLQWLRDGKQLVLHGQDDTGFFWAYEDVAPGRFLLSAEYEIADGAAVDAAAWRGKVKVGPVAFALVEPRAGLALSAPVRVAGVAFEAAVEPLCPVPPAGGRQPLDLGLSVTNSGDKLLLLNLYDTLRPRLKSAAGKEFQVGGERLRTAPAWPVLVGPGKVETILRHAHLAWQADGKALQLSGPDGSAGTWHVDGLEPGKYLLRFEYENNAETLATFLRARPLWEGRKASFWVGKVSTPEVQFTIGPAAPAGAAGAANVPQQKDEAQEAALLGKINQADYVFTAKVAGATVAPTDVDGPVYYHLELAETTMLRGKLPAQFKFLTRGIDPGRKPDYPIETKWLFATSDFHSSKGDVMVPVNCRLLQLAKEALALPLGWTLEGGRPLSPWVGLGTAAWPKGAKAGPEPVCRATARPALLAGADIEITTKQVLPAAVNPNRNPYGDGRFTVTVTNRGAKAVAVPALLSDGKNILWEDSLVVLDVSTETNHGTPCFLPGAGKAGKAKAVQAVVLQPQESVSATVDVLRARGVYFSPGGARYYYRFCLGEKSVMDFFYYHSDHHEPLRKAGGKG
jgi:RNA polymerase sigma factor (sigma-70 family)